MKTDLQGEGIQELINTWLSLYLIHVGHRDRNNVTYHHASKLTSTTTHFNDIGLMVTLSLLVASHLSVSLIQPLGRPLQDPTTKQQLI